MYRYALSTEHKLQIVLRPPVTMFQMRAVACQVFVFSLFYRMDKELQSQSWKSPGSRSE